MVGDHMGILGVVVFVFLKVEQTELLWRKI
jgi:hypothetical protein